jgi:hypothetical protein
VYSPFLWSGYLETLAENLDAFNSNSRGALDMRTAMSVGNYQYKSFIESLAAGGISRRDITSTSAAAATAVTMNDFISVKLNRKIGPIDAPVDAFKKAGISTSDPREFSFLLGQAFAKGVAYDFLNSGLTAVVASLAGTSAVLHDISAYGTTTTTANTDDLIDVLSKMGDRLNDVVCWVMHSVPYYALMKEQLGMKVTNISDLIVAEATPATLNRPVIVTDVSALTGSSTGSCPDFTHYWTLGLTRSAVVVEESEERTMVNEWVTGQEQLCMRTQGEYAFNVGVKGYQYDVSNGGVNPTAGTLGTTTNWDQVAASVKDGPGAILKSR